MFRANPLTRGQQKKIKLLRNEAEDKEISAQDSIPYRKMYPDGICRVTENRYSRCIRFEDTNYQLLQPDAKTGVFDNWCSFLNYFDSSVLFELTFLVRPASREKIAQRIEIPATGDDHEYIREEFETILRTLTPVLQIGKHFHTIDRTLHIYLVRRGQSEYSLARYPASSDPK